MDLSTNNETSFFRDPKIFKAVENLVLDKVDKNKKLKIWSAASSAGQEALSISMMIHEWNIKQLSQIQFSIIATDISTRILEKAKSATYTQLEAQRGLPTQLLIKYFKKDDQDKWVAEKILRDHIEFKKLNLREYFSFPEPFDIIFCRNVLIYQSVPSKTEILSKITKQLVPQGVLVLGSGESLLGLSTDYEQLSSDGAVVYRKKS